MTNLNKLSNKELAENLNALVRQERRITTDILWHLKEVHERKLFAALGYSSLFDYCVRALNYSEAAAFRRIEAMRVLRELPEIAQAIENGSLSVTAVCLAWRVFKSQTEFMSNNDNANNPTLIAARGQTQAKQFGLDEKRELLNSLIGKSKRECEKLLAAISPQAIPKESARVLTAELTEIKFVAGDGLVKKLERIKHLLAHKNSNPTTAALIEMMADLVLKKIDPMAKNSRPLAQSPKARTAKDRLLKSPTPAEVKVSDEPGTGTGTVPGTVPVPVTVNRQPLPGMHLRINTKLQIPETKPANNSRYIPQSLKRFIWQRDQGRCTFRTQGNSCESTHALEIDHIQPFACDGQNTPENLRLLCRTHNQYRARQMFEGTQ